MCTIVWHRPMHTHTHTHILTKGCFTFRPSFTVSSINNSLNRRLLSGPVVFWVIPGQPHRAIPLNPNPGSALVPFHSPSSPLENQGE